MYLENSFKDAAYSIYSVLREAHPVIKIISVVSIVALTVWKLSTREQPVQKLTTRAGQWFWVERDLKGNDEKFKNTLKSIYTLDSPLVLNTNLEQQSRPNRFLMGMNKLAIDLGYKDRLTEIRAVNVLSKIKEFIQNNPDNIFLNQHQNIHLVISDSLKNLKLDKKYSKQIEEIKEITKNIKPTSWKIVSQLEDVKIAHLPYVEEIRKAADEGDKEAVSLLQKAAKIQTNWIIDRAKNRPYLLQNNPWYIEEPYIYQTEPLNNAYIQLASCYFKRNETKLAKEMILQAFEATDVDTMNWKDTLDENFFQFFQECCLDLHNELLKQDIDDKKHANLLFAKLIVSGKELILTSYPENASYLANSLVHLQRHAEALECYKIAIETCEEKDKAKNYRGLIEQFSKQNNPLSAIEWAKKFFPINPKEPKKLGQDEWHIWKIYQFALECQKEKKDFSVVPFGKFSRLQER